MTYQFNKMEQSQVDEFLATPHHAIVAINRLDAPPLISPVWYLYEDGSIYFSVQADSAKCRHLRRDSRIAICIDGAFSDTRAVTIYGIVELNETDTPERDDIFLRTTGRYTDDNSAIEAYLDEAKAGSGYVQIKAVIEKMIARDFNA